MSSSSAIQISIGHTVLGVSVGALIEGLLPKFTEGASLPSQVFEALVQVGLNGAALVSVSSYLRDGDPTHGIPFSFALFQAQPELGHRIASLATVVRQQVAQAAQRMGGHASVL